MKKIFLIFAFFTTLLCNAQFSTNNETLELTYKAIFEVKATKNIIKNNTNKWFAKNFKDANSVIKSQTDDGIIGKGVFKISSNINGSNIIYNVNFIIDVAFKDNKYKLEFYNLETSITGTDIKTTVYNLENISKEKYLEISINETTKLGNTEYVEALKKQLSNPDTFNVIFESAKNINKQQIQSIKENIKNLSESLLNEFNSDEW